MAVQLRTRRVRLQARLVAEADLAVLIGHVQGTAARVDQQQFTGIVERQDFRSIPKCI